MCRLFVLASVFLLVLAACAAPSATPQKQVVPVSENPVPQPAASWQSEWDKVVAKAKKEGVVAVSGSGGANLRDALIGAFKARYGINLEMISGKGAQLAERLVTEQRNGLYLWDVQTSGAATMLNNVKPSGAFVPLEAALIRPDILDPQYWQPGQPSWVDKDHMIFSIEYSASGKLGINTNLVKPDEIKSLRDLLNPKWKGKIIFNDPTISGTGSKFMRVVAELHGWDIWREIARQEPLVMRDERLMVDWLARGKYPVVISPKPEPMAEAKEAGAPVEVIAIEGVRWMGGDTVSLLKNAPHPNAAKVYINWLLSKEGQTAYHTAQGSWSGRKDVVLNSTPSKKPDPGVTYFNGNAEEFLLNQPEQMNMAKEIFMPILTPTPSPSPTPTPGFARVNPADIGSALLTKVDSLNKTYEFRITLLEVVRGEAAWKRIIEANRYNQPPALGFEYILANIRFEYFKGPSQDTQYDLNPTTFTVVSSEGKDYERLSITEPNPNLRAKLYPAAWHEGWVAFRIATSDAAPLVTFGRDYQGRGGVWWKLYK